MSKRLLLADDSITIQKVIGITFANEDYELVVVDNGDAALKKALENRPDLVLADVYMPGKNGYELCAAVKSEASLQGVPVLLLAGTFEPFDEAKALSSGADAWISKPFESQALIDKVEGLLARPAAAAPAPAVQSQPPVAPPRHEPAPAVATAPPIAGAVEEPAADDIWGDMGDDLFAEEQPVVAAPSDEGEDDLWGALSADDFAEEAPAVQTSQAAPAAPIAPVPSQDDDLWGALDEEMAEPAIAADDTDFSFDEAPVADLAAEVDFADEPASSEGEDIFSLDEGDILAEEDIELLEETAIGVDDFEFDDNRVADAVPEPDRIDVATVATESPVSSTEDELDWGDLAEPSEMAQMYESFEEELTPPPMPAVTPEPEPAPFSSPAPVSAAPAPAPRPEPAVAPLLTPTPAAPAASPSAQVEQAVAALSEEQLSAIVERVAASMLEKIAWEVVPDLAENLIKEELRRIREEAG